MSTVEDVLVGVDFGTTSCKAGVVDLGGRELAHARVPTPWQHVETGAELDPEAFVDVTLAAVRAALERAGGGRVLGLGVTSMAETGVLLDRHGSPVAHAIAWHDSRGVDGARRIAEEVGRDRFITRTGLPPRPLCTLSKYLWMREHLSAAADGVRWLNVSDWIVHRLGAEQAAELSLAARTGWLDLVSRTWWDETLALADAPEGFLPEPVQAGTNVGRASGPAWLEGAALTVGGHDHVCGAVGAGALGDDVVYDSCGTAEAFIAQLGAPAEAGQVLRLVERGITVGWHVVSERHALLGAQRAGLGLQRFRSLLGAGEADHAALDAAALAAPDDAAGLVVVDVDADVAALTDIGLNPTPGLVWRAALNAVADRAAAILAAMEAERGAIADVVVAGGWARSEAFRTVKAARQGPFRHAASVQEPGVRGAALLGGVAAGIYERVADLPAPAELAPVADGGTSEGRST